MDSEQTATLVYVPTRALKGRGTAWAIEHRFSTSTREALDDGWHTLAQAAEEDEQAPAPNTRVLDETVRSILTRNDSPDIGFDLSINPYRGCEHGCSYCYARPTHSWLNLSPGLDFETRIIAKVNAAEKLREALAAPGYRPGLLNIGSATDAYQPVERRLRITRSLIEVLQGCQHPFSLVTKSSLVERDLDLIAPMAAAGLVAVYVSLTTLDPDLARVMEPRAAAPHRRLRTVEALARAGVPVGVSLSPIVPFLNEPELERLLAAARDAGASRAFSTVLRLPWELSPLFRQWLQQHRPEQAERIMARVQDLHGGRDYRADYGTRMKGQGVWADLLRQRFVKACQRLGLGRSRFELDMGLFTPPAQPSRSPAVPVPGPQAQGQLF
jgi:DNA repair photolyase